MSKKNLYEIESLLGLEKPTAEDLFAIGLMCEYGQGDMISKDYKDAFECYEQAANLDHPKAQCKIGCFYYFGKHVKVNYTKAFNYFSKGIELGDPECYTRIACMYYMGRGLPENKPELFENKIFYAKTNLIKAAEHQLPDANYLLGRIYYDEGCSIGNLSITKQGVAYIKKAANNNHKEGQLFLSYIYRTLDSKVFAKSPKSHENSIYWFNRGMQNIMLFDTHKMVDFK